MERWVARILEHQERHGFGLFTVVERASGETIGDCGFELMELDGATEAELGYDLRRDRWGHGLATEGAGAVLEHGMTTLGLARIVSLVRVGNERSARVAERIGMHRERTLERGGIHYELYVFSP